MQGAYGHKRSKYSLPSPKARAPSDETSCTRCNDLDWYNVDPVTNVVCQAIGLGSKLGLNIIDAVAVVCFAISLWHFHHRCGSTAYSECLECWDWQDLWHRCDGPRPTCPGRSSSDTLSSIEHLRSGSSYINNKLGTQQARGPT